MTPKFKKLAVAAGVSAGLAAVSMPSHAVIPGAAGEALLVPLVVYATAENSGYDANTIIEIAVSGSIGFDDVPNLFTAPSSSPTNPGEALYPNDQVGGTSSIHWYWFDNRSVHRLDRELNVTSNDVAVINWADGAQSAGDRYDGVAGYMVISTEDARNGQAANFNMFGNAWLEVALPGNTVDAVASIPVLPLADGPDADAVSVTDNVIYRGGIPADVSPLISGMRTNRSDGIADLIAWDMPIRSRVQPNIHVVWLDENVDFAGVPVDVFDSEEIQCSSFVDLPNELNVIWIPHYRVNAAGGVDMVPAPIDRNNNAGLFATQVQPLCLPEPTPAGIARSGFASYQMPEYKDNNVNAPESAGIAFTLNWELNSNGNTLLQQTMSPAHERGSFRY